MLFSKREIDTIKKTYQFAFSSVLFLISLFVYALLRNATALFLSLLIFALLIHVCEKSFSFTVSVNQEWPNSTISESIKQINDLVKKAQTSIVIVSGSLSHVIYENNKILKSFNEKKAAIDDGSLSLKIYLTGDNIDPKTKQFLKYLMDLNIIIIKIKEGCIKHFVAVDGIHVRLEEKHEKYAIQRRAVLRYSTPLLANKALRLLNDCEYTNKVGEIRLSNNGSNGNV